VYLLRHFPWKVKVHYHIDKGPSLVPVLFSKNLSNTEALYYPPDLLRPQPDVAPCRGDMDPLHWGCIGSKIKALCPEDVETRWR
jgi:hypothetical protein